MKAVTVFVIGVALGWLLRSTRREGEAEPQVGYCSNCGKTHTLPGCPYPVTSGLWQTDEPTPSTKITSTTGGWWYIDDYHN